MRKLESTIAQFVSDLLQTIGEASVDELRELFDGPPGGEKVFEAPLDPPAPPSPPIRLLPTLAPPRQARDEGQSRGAPPRRSFGSRFTTSPGPFLPAGVAEITDPESLLSLGAPSKASGSDGASSSPSFGEPRAPSRARAQALLEVSEVREHATSTDAQRDRHPEPEGESPASGIRPVGSGMTVRLSDNETLARVSNSGVVIRRRKRA